jgi:peptide/nickel transport system permease protein
MPPLLVQLSLAMGFAVLAEASLSFLGLGTSHPIQAGVRLSRQPSLLREAPWYGLWPGRAHDSAGGAQLLSDAPRHSTRRVR